MSVSRGRFLRSLGSSVTGMALGTGVAKAAQALASRLGNNAPPQPAADKLPESPIRFIDSGPAEGNRIALTFDDGPTPGVTDYILDELKTRQARATFFMIGQRVVAEPDLARRVLAEGHEIANHSFTHPKLSTMPDAQVDAELQKTEDAFGELLNHRASWFRPPYGAFRKTQGAIPRSKGLGIVFWNVDPSDWSQPGEDKIVGTVWSQTKPGSIIVCHDMHRQTAQCVGRMIDGLLERNFSLVKLSDLLGREVK